MLAERSNLNIVNAFGRKHGDELFSVGTFDTLRIKHSVAIEVRYETVTQRLLQLWMKEM